LSCIATDGNIGRMINDAVPAMIIADLIKLRGRRSD